ncbi:histidinol-phosphatase (PHP family) [Halomicrobium zhouii]|uniref:histidinol-phosphatase n=1 Tax=Halomicrobium zhouii TaxID=767519 RepID=A0A1I6KNV4_9EURY|nr:PHP domain-containing protein [Halomicrobium zhouii]SFR92668.1 histidinol-phosphatase (PHP family) [Halomicrobium zhouii]
MRDYHVHSNYSDGRFLFQMARAAEEAGLDGVGFADHCTVTEREDRRGERAEYAFNLDMTYERRRRGIGRLREEFDLAVYDAVEMDYDPRDEGAIGSFLDEAGFDYAVGSVHELDGVNVQVPSYFADRSDDALDALVDEYFDRLVSLAESELFDVAAHPDLIERTGPLRGRATEAQYDRVAEAFAESRTVPEINAGRALTDLDLVHPSEGLLDAFREYDVGVTLGTDSHYPDEIGSRAAFLTDFVAERDLELADPPGLNS